MKTLLQKFQDIDIAMAKFKSLRKKYKSAKRNFKCVEIHTDIVLNESGAHSFVTSNVCKSYNAYSECVRCDCPYNNWNVGYVHLLNRFRDAKQERNRAILNLFKLKQK